MMLLMVTTTHTLRSSQIFYSQ